MPWTGQDASGGGPLRVDAPRLGGAARAAEVATTGQFRPDVVALYDQYRVGTPFGRSHRGSAMTAARSSHHGCLQSTSAVLSEYVGASALLVEAIRTVVSTYGGADMSSEANNRAVTAILQQAITAAEAVRRQAEVASRRDARTSESDTAALPGEFAL